MTDLLDIRHDSPRLRLLTTVSLMALAATLYGTRQVAAQQPDSDPKLWVSLGWHTDSVYDSNDSFALPASGLIAPEGLTGPLEQGLNLSRENGVDGKLTFQPHGTDWVLSASVQYGRSHGKGSFSQTKALPTTSFVTFHTTIPTYPFPYHRTLTKPLKQSTRSINGETVSAETHLLLDFEAGKDVGLGLFGQGGTSTIGAGVRFAQFTSALNTAEFHAKTGFHFGHFQYTIPTIAPFPSGIQIVPWYKEGYQQMWQSLAGSSQSTHDFTGAGPSVYWDVSTPLIGNPERGGQLLLDWGVNAAILFGKQKNTAQHQTSGNNNCYGRHCSGPTVRYQTAGHTTSTRRVTVPNVGGFMGVSYRVQDFRFSAGYRGDYFFNAISTSFAGAKSEDRAFFGPFAKVSVAIGD